MRTINRFTLLAFLLLTPCLAQAQGNAVVPAGPVPTTAAIGSGYSIANGQLYVQASPSLNSLALPFTISIDVVAPNASGSGDFFIGSNTQGSTAGGFALGYFSNSQTFNLQTIIQPSNTTGGLGCTHTGAMCWRFPVIEDGNRHNLCVRWSPTTGSSGLYVDGILRDQNIAVSPGIFAPSPELFWSLGAGAPSTWTLYDARVYSSDIGPRGCKDLANFNSQGLYPTSGPFSIGMVLHLPLNNCTVSSGTYTCADTSGNNNNAATVNVAPSVSILTPATGIVTDSVNITASCVQAGFVCAYVCYYDDNVLISPSCQSNTTAPYTFSWNSATVVDGSHSLTAVGYNAAGSNATSAAVAITTANGTSPITYNFNSSTGSDSNNCTASACKTVAKFQTLTLHGGDTVNFVGTGFSSTGSLLLICGPGASAQCTQNFYPSSSTLTISGPNTCNPFTGSSSAAPTDCATITRTGTGTASGVQFWNATNVTVKNFALQGTGNTATAFPRGAFEIDATTIAQLGQSANVTIQNNYTFNWNYGTVTGTLSESLGGSAASNSLGPISNLQVIDNYVTATGRNGSGIGPTNSPDGGILIGAATQALVEGNLTENAGGHGDAQGNGLGTQNWPNPGGSSTPTIFQFNVTHDNGGGFQGGSGGPYSLYSIGGDNTIFQFNEEYNQACWTVASPSSCPGAVDNGGADIDTGSTHILTQYNYIHDNIQTNSNAMLFFPGSRANVGGNPGWGDNYYRFNIAENYYTGMQQSGGGSPTTGGSNFYNNTLSSNQGNSTGCGNGQNCTSGACYLSAGGNNNLCINNAPSNLVQWYYWAQGFCGPGDYNDYYNVNGAGGGWVYNFTTKTTLASWQAFCAPGHSYGDLHSLNVNPQIAGAIGSTGSCWTEGSTTAPAGPQNTPGNPGCPANYQLTSSSTALIGTGVAVSLTSPTVYSNPTVDYYGNAVPNGAGSGWNIGADNGLH